MMHDGAANLFAPASDHDPGGASGSSGANVKRDSPCSRKNKIQ